MGKDHSEEERTQQEEEDETDSEEGMLVSLHVYIRSLTWNVALP